jgi:GDP-L-fucose synthase
MDVSRLKELGWESTTPIDLGLKRAYRWYVENVAGAVAHTG